MEVVRLLVLGGTWFLGATIVEHATARRWDVTTFNRGRTGLDVAGARLIRGDREQADDLLQLAAAGPWDAVIDASGSVPAIVRRSARALADVVGRYVYVSSVAAHR